MSVFNWMRSLAKANSPTRQLINLKDQLEKEHKEVQNFILEYQKEFLTNRYCSIQKGPCNTSGFFFWEKDENHRYTSANEQHCVEFFGLPSDCHEKIIGKSDIDLVNEYRERTGKCHTYGDLCKGTDDILKEEKKTIRFIEIGYIDVRMVILDVIKYPVLEGDEYKGSYGIALDAYKHGYHMNHLLTNGIKNNCISPIEVSKTAAVYRLHELGNLNPFENGFPT